MLSQNLVEILIVVAFASIGFFCFGHFDGSIAARNLPEFLSSMKAYIWQSFWFWLVATSVAAFAVHIRMQSKFTNKISLQEASPTGAVETQVEAESDSKREKSTAIIDRTSWSIFFTALLYVVLTRCWQFPVASDDSYIDYRYVHNLVRLGTFDYNPGLHVMGFTSHLHLFVLSALCVIFRTNDVAVVSQQLNIFCQILACALLFRLVSKVLNSPCAALACVLFAVDSYLITEVAYGKETSIVILLMLVAISSWNGLRPHLFAWSNSLLFLTRPEGVAWLAIAFLWHFKKIKLKVWRYWAVPIFLITSWYCFLFYYFHAFMPHGALAKAKVYMPRLFITTAIELGGFMSNFFAPLHLRSDGHPLTYYNIISALHGWQYLWALVAGLLVLTALFMTSKNKPWLRFYFTGVAGTYAVFSLSNPWMFSWYYSWFSLIPIFMVPVVVLSIYKSNLKLRPMLIGTLTLWCVFVPLVQQPMHSGIFGLPVIIWESVEARLLLYREAAIYLNDLEALRFDNSRLEAGKASETAAYEPGIFGYYYKGLLLDLDGLVSDEPLAYYPVSEKERAPGASAGIPALAVEKLKPRRILFFDWIGYGLLRDQNFCRHYKLEKEWEANIDAAKSLKLYKLND